MPSILGRVPLGRVTSDPRMIIYQLLYLVSLFFILLGTSITALELWQAFLGFGEPSIVAAPSASLALKDPSSSRRQRLSAAEYDFIGDEQQKRKFAVTAANGDDTHQVTNQIVKPQLHRRLPHHGVGERRDSFVSVDASANIANSNGGDAPEEAVSSVDSTLTSGSSNGGRNDDSASTRFAIRDREARNLRRALLSEREDEEEEKETKYENAQKNGDYVDATIGSSRFRFRPQAQHVKQVVLVNGVDVNSKKGYISNKRNKDVKEDSEEQQQEDHYKFGTYSPKALSITLDFKKYLHSNFYVSFYSLFIPTLIGESKTVLSADVKFILSHIATALLLCYPAALCVERRKFVLDFILSVYLIYYLATVIVTRTLFFHPFTFWMSTTVSFVIALFGTTQIAYKREMTEVLLGGEMGDGGSAPSVNGGGGPSSSAAAGGSSANLGANTTTTGVNMLTGVASSSANAMASPASLAS